MHENWNLWPRLQSPTVELLQQYLILFFEFDSENCKNLILLTAYELNGIIYTVYMCWFAYNWIDHKFGFNIRCIEWNLGLKKKSFWLKLSYSQLGCGGITVL